MSDNNHHDDEPEEAASIPEIENILPENLDDLYKEMPLTDETTCGIWIFKGAFLQRFANKKAFVLFYGITGAIYSAAFAYFNGTITTIEKRYKIPSKNTGIISVGNDISAFLLTMILSYYAGKGHRPRWIAFGLFTIFLFCLMTALPHLMYGPGEEALALTTEFGASFDDETTFEVLEQEKRKTLCRLNGTIIDDHCAMEEGNLAPQVILFTAQFVSGIGYGLFHTLGSSYMDDNIQKSKTPALISVSFFIKMLGPALGYALASFSIKFYISPTLTPTITNSDPRWLGAWWMGWIVLGLLTLLFGFILGLFPKTLPRSAVRKRIEVERKKRLQIVDKEESEDMPTSLRDMIATLKRLVTNRVLMLINMAEIFYFFGYMPYYIFTPKYIETQYRQSASTSSLITGTVVLMFSAFGVLLSGTIISRYKPRARLMGAWNTFVGLVSISGMITYAFLGCDANENSLIINQHSISDLTLNSSCNAGCGCEYITYSPICGEDNNTYISPCHAGCVQSEVKDNEKFYSSCSCISSPANEIIFSGMNDLSNNGKRFAEGGSAVEGPCPIDCQREFYLFLSVMCLLKFFGATGMASNFLLSIRCVDKRDKAVAMAFGLMLMSLFSFIPSPIFFGSILDRTCLVWGKTCSGSGNCWLYDGGRLRYLMNFFAASFTAVGAMFDFSIWYNVKGMPIFDKDEEMQLHQIALDDMKIQKSVKANSNKHLYNNVNKE